MKVKVAKKPQVLQKVPECGDNLAGPSFAMAGGMPSLKLFPIGSEVSG